MMGQFIQYKRLSFRRIMGTISGVLFSLAFLAGAHAQGVETLNGDELETLLENAGLSPDMRTDSATGAPVALGQVGEYSFVVRALNCSGTPKACGELLFFANFPLGRALTVADLLAVNNFNERQVFGRAYVLRTSGEKGQVGVDYVIELSGGVSKAHIEQNVARWADVVAAFIESITAAQADS